MKNLSFGKLTDPGIQRENENEDFLGFNIPEDTLINEKYGSLFIVADGMGGCAGGEEASKLACETTIREYFDSKNSLDPKDDLENAIKKANIVVYNKASSNQATDGMGSTLAAVLVIGRTAYISNVGDSRVYHIRKNSIQQLTKDHSWIAEMLKSGVLTPEQAENHPYRNMITRSIGEKPTVEIDTLKLHLMKGDIFVLCTDGLSSCVSANEILVHAKKNNPQAACYKLIQLANQRGGPDNISVIIIKIHYIPIDYKVSIQKYALPVIVLSLIVLILWIGIQKINVVGNFFNKEQKENLQSDNTVKNSDEKKTEIKENPGKEQKTNSISSDQDKTRDRPK